MIDLTKPGDRTGAPEMTDHPNAEDYRNRAERAEQELAELHEVAESMADALEHIKGSYGCVVSHSDIIAIARDALAAYNLHNLK